MIFPIKQLKINKGLSNFLKKYKAKGSALIFTMFILSGMLIVAMGGAYVILLGITAANTQAQSTKAYFAAEAGSEHILWQFRKNGAEYGNEYLGTGTPILTGSLDDDLSYQVFHTDNDPMMSQHNYTAIGNYFSVKRSVEISF